MASKVEKAALDLLCEVSRVVSLLAPNNRAAVIVDLLYALRYEIHNSQTLSFEENTFAEQK